jgi:hypothetical protein
MDFIFTLRHGKTEFMINQDTNLKKFYKTTSESDEVEIHMIKSGYYTRATTNPPKTETYVKGQNKVIPSEKKPNWLEKVNARVEQTSKAEDFQENAAKRYNDAMQNSDFSTKSKQSDHMGEFGLDDFSDICSGLDDDTLQKKRDFFSDGDDLGFIESCQEFWKCFCLCGCLRRRVGGVRAGGGPDRENLVRAGEELGPRGEDEMVSEQEAFRRIQKSYMGEDEVEVELAEGEDTDQVIREKSGVDGEGERVEGEWQEVGEVIHRDECTENVRPTSGSK